VKISDSKLEHLHAALMKQFKEVLGQKGRSNLSMKYSKNPKDVPADSALTCELVYSNEGGFVDRAPRRRGAPQSVIILPTQFDGIRTPAAWVGWYEEWRRQGAKGGTFDLVGASMTFFWGYINRERTELLRAEWDTEHRGGGITAAQPHWHVDSDIVLLHAESVRAHLDSESDTEEALMELEMEEVSALEEVNKQPPRAKLSLSPMHLGMGGWSHGKANPGRWQCKVRDNDITAFVDWAHVTLDYVIQEIGRIRLEKRRDG